MLYPQEGQQLQHSGNLSITMHHLEQRWPPNPGTLEQRCGHLRPPSPRHAEDANSHLPLTPPPPFNPTSFPFSLEKLSKCCRPKSIHSVTHSVLVT